MRTRVVGAALMMGVAFWAGSSLASSTADADLSVGLRFPPPPKPPPPPKVGLVFDLEAGVTNNGPADTNARYLLDVPPGLRVIGGSLGCPNSTGTLDCGTDDFPSGLTIGPNSIALIASAPGTYNVVLRLVDSTVADPNPSDNTASVTFTIAPAAPQLKASAVRLTPAKPKAGATFRASIGLLDQTDTRVVPSSVRCSARIGTARVPSKPSVAAGNAVCTFRPPASARGKTLHGSIVASAKGASLTRAFAVRLR